MVYRLLAVNIDGTLIQSNGRLNKLTKEAMEYVHQKGVNVALVTSRNFHSANKVAKALKINPMLITHQGAFVGTKVDKPIYVNRIPEDLSLEVVQLLEKTECQIQLVHEEALIGNRINLPEHLLSKSVMNMNDSSFFAQNYFDVLSEEIKMKPFVPIKIDVIFQDEKDQVDYLGLLQKLFPEIETVVKPNQKLTMVTKGVSKWNGVMYYADYLGIKRNEIVAIGDGLDDLEMIAESGLGVAMGNAPATVKQAAKWVTRTNDEQGVAYMLKEFFRKQHPIEFLTKMNMLK